MCLRGIHRRVAAGALALLLNASAARAGKFDIETAAEPTVARPSPARWGGKLLATGGLSSLDGAGGGGIVPWALLAGNGVRGQAGGTAFFTHLALNDFRLNVVGGAFTFSDRFEVSFAQQSFQFVGTVLPGNTIRQRVIGVKARLFGDAIFDDVPQVAAGAEYKHNLDPAIPYALGAKRSEDTEVYLVATKVFLGGAAGLDALVSAGVRASRANQMGLLGFGGDRSDSHRLIFESSAAVFLDRNTAIGAEWRVKPRGALSAAPEDDWRDAFIAYFPSKSLALVLAYADLGRVAGKSQSGLYLSAQAGF